MYSNTNSTIGGFLILASIGTGYSNILQRDIESLANYSPSKNHKFELLTKEGYMVENNSTNKTNINLDDYIKVESLLEFSKKLVENSIDIDGEFVDIVNDNFWDII